jgi:hypothetical protein
MKSVSPIALFVYNRPQHVRRTVAALAKNLGAPDAVLHIYSDAAKSEADITSVNEVRNFIRQITGFKQVIFVERAENFGLAKSIIDGVTDLCTRYGRVIVLEDDLETSPYFLNFMNEALNYYENTPEVMHVSGCRFPVEPFGMENTFFLHVPLCWGWATWERAWTLFEKDISIMQRFDSEMIKRFDFDNTYRYWKQLELNKSGIINTWFVFWYANLFLCNGLSLFPSQSLVRNIGFDGSGVHGGNSIDYQIILSLAPVKVEGIELKESCEGFNTHKEYFKKINPNLLIRVLRKIFRSLGRYSFWD